MTNHQETQRYAVNQSKLTHNKAAMASRGLLAQLPK
jgi:hypothetical protein